MVKQVPVTKSFYSTLHIVLNSPVVWWCSANLFSCKLEGGWWAPAIQQNFGSYVQQLRKASLHHYTWEYVVTYNRFAEKFVQEILVYCFVQCECVDLQQPQLKPEN